MKNRPFAAGIIIGIAALFKVFPIAIAMVLGFKNWRILILCMLTFAVALILPGSKEWIASFTYTPFLTQYYSIIYMWLKNYNLAFYVAYVAIVSGTTALVAFKCKDADYPLLATLAIPAVFLTMPVIEYFHLVILIFPYAYLLTRKLHHSYYLIVAISFVIIYFGGFFFPRDIIAVNVNE